MPAWCEIAVQPRIVKLDLNSDLGEGEPPALTRALMRWITSANVACGGHAGNLRTMEACVRLAKRYGVRLGAHPGPWNRDAFGRVRVGLRPEELELLLLHQVGGLSRVAQANGVRLQHIKLHGALYHASEEDNALASAYAAVVKRLWPSARIYARAGGRVARVARRAGLVVWEEAFADRAYQDDGSLVPRTEPGALVSETAEVARRVRRLLQEGEVATQSGKRIALRPQTVCIHSDTAHSAHLARVVSQVLGLRKRLMKSGA
jgi:5-oxoprolinase (ATP-hydrolysing) subunit A